MADHMLAGRDGGWVRERLAAKGMLENGEVALGKGNQERLEHDNGLSQAGIQVVVVRIHLSPHFLGIYGESFHQIVGSVAEIIAKFFDHLLQRAYFMKELEPMGKEHAVEHAAHASRTLALLSLKIGGIERSSVGNGSVMLGVLGQSMKQACERLGQQRAKPRSNTQSLQGLADVSQLPKFDSLIERYARHRVVGFEFVGLLVESECCLFL